MNESEIKIAQMLGDVWAEYIKLPEEHPCEREDFCDAIHVCQYIIMSRGGQRLFNSMKENPDDLV